MQSTWQRIARESVRRWVPVPARLAPIRCAPALHNRSSTAPFNTFRRALSTSTFTPSSPSPSTSSSPPLSASRHALIASHAIRLSVAQGSLPDAYLILNSIHFASTSPRTPRLLRSLTALLPQNALAAEPVPFSSATPVRLATHTLLHALVRHGYLPEAARLAEELVGSGVRLRKWSLDSLFAALTLPEHNLSSFPSAPSKSSSLSLSSFAGRRPSLRPCPRTLPIRTSILRNVDILRDDLSEEHVATPGGKHAVRLLQVARKSRQRRTQAMFTMLIRLCIINGEIIAASLVFGLMMRDWNARVADVHVEEPGALNVTEKEKEKKIQKGDVDVMWARGREYGREREKGRGEMVVQHPPGTLQTPLPQAHILSGLVEGVEEIFRAQDPRARPYRPGAVQALANMAAMVDERQVPLAALVKLVRCLREAGGMRVVVRVPRRLRGEEEEEGGGGRAGGGGGEGGMRDVMAGEYFQEVLERLCRDLPPHSVAPGALSAPVTQNGGYTPAPDAWTLRALLGFALRERRDWALGRPVLGMLEERGCVGVGVGWEVAEGIRQASVLFGGEEGEEAWRVAERLSGEESCSTKHSGKRKGKGTKDGEEGRMSNAAERYAALLGKSKSAQDARIRVDFLTSIGRGDLVAPYLPLLLPGWHFRAMDPRHAPRPPSSAVSLGERVRAYREAVERGPRVVVSVLGAMERAGYVDAGMAVWRWAREVEEFGWVEARAAVEGRSESKSEGEREGCRDSDSDVDVGRDGESASVSVMRPWSLPIAAHTLALKLYAERLRRVCVAGERGEAGSGEVRRWVGWLRKRAMRTFRDALEAEGVREEGVRVHGEHEVPRLDPVFFDAALDVVGRIAEGQVGQVQRAEGEREGKLRRRRKRAVVEEELEELEREGKRVQVENRASVDLMAVGREMMERGFPLPVGYRRYFVGRDWDYGENENGAAELWRLGKRWRGVDPRKGREGGRREEWVRRERREELS
ncbi:hypothetical protein D9611_002862 [Ephemerocybe angulata]|uniref:Uncharacterized protein n=1 Tax=Ephemerocybe angulata TaxID=980116 RepID=A0A8H5FHG5_9AGAR|nr:hypothetical protein D9611_002862 [Tulosesus angulatus]